MKRLSRNDRVIFGQPLHKIDRPVEVSSFYFPAWIVEHHKRRMLFYNPFFPSITCSIAILSSGPHSFEVFPLPPLIISRRVFSLECNGLNFKIFFYNTNIKSYKVKLWLIERVNKFRYILSVDKFFFCLFLWINRISILKIYLFKIYSSYATM